MTKQGPQPGGRTTKLPIARKEKEALLDDFRQNHPLQSSSVETGKRQPLRRTQSVSIEDIKPVGRSFLAAEEAVVPMEIEDISCAQTESMQDQEPQDVPMEAAPPTSYPTAAELYKSSRMKPEIGRYWRTESTTQYCLFQTVKSKFLSVRDMKSVGRLSRGYDQMVESVMRARTIDFSPLRQPCFDYADQQEIDPARVAMLESCAIHYNLDFGLVVRYLAGEHTAEHRSLERLEEEVGQHIPAEDMEHIRRIFMKGCPNTLDFEMKHKDKMKIIERGNQPPVEQNMEVVRETLNKEERNSHVVPFPIWQCIFSPYANHNAQGIVFKEGSNPRLVWDATTKLEPDDVVTNDYVRLDGEPPITFGRTLRDFATHLYNTRVSYPDQDIDIAAADVKACFRWPRLFPEFAAPFGFIITGMYYFICTAMVFGSRVSASSWEPFRRTIETMTAKYFADTSLVATYKEYLDKITIEPPAPEGTPFVRAAPCALNKGVLDDDGNQLPVKAFIYVDDCLLAAVRTYIVQLMCACIHAIFVVLGFPDTAVRQCPLAMNKWTGMLVGHSAILLGLQFDSRQLTLGITDKYRLQVLSLLQDEWPRQVRTFTLHKLVRLAGKLARLGEGAPWVFHLMQQVFASIAYALRQNHLFLKNESASFQQMIKQIKALKKLPTTDQDVSHLNFFLSKSAKKKFKCAQSFFIPKTLRRELELLRAWLSDESGITWSTPLAHLIKRMPYALAWGDACLYGGGGFSLKLRFWWHLQWPLKVQRKTKLYLKDDSNKDFVSINVLEFVTIIINFAGALTALTVDGHPDDPFPVLLNFADNMSSVRWTNHYCKGSMKARALGLLFCCLLANCFLGINAKWTAGDENDIADAISRTKNVSDPDGTNHRSFDYSLLVQQFPQLKLCRRFHPRPEFLSLIWQTIQTGQLPEQKMIMEMRREGLGKLSI